ncbi:MAG: prepilin-type N-terminal cleavage/methylation domain-containing protein, partial [Phycisphaerae bacterium]|nr:prepilin-type N-terminal cleavage/methylation domain-containing protein [Phycisphaerae bacterium]
MKSEEQRRYSGKLPIMINNIAMKSKRGFTIWELLCVILIIVLLLALLMPALERSRSMATVSICMSYLRNYSIDGLQYLDDNDGVFPEANEWLYTKKSDSADHPIGCRWHDQAMAPGGRIMGTSPEYRGKMWEYIGEMGIRPCPTFRRYARSRGCENPDHNGDIDIRPQYSYTMNGYLGTTNDGGVLKVNEVREPSEVFFFAEENSWSLRPDH